MIVNYYLLVCTSTRWGQKVSSQLRN